MSIIQPPVFANRRWFGLYWFDGHIDSIISFWN